MSQLRVVIAEDEATIARRLARLTSDILGPQAGAMTIAPSVAEARAALEAAPADLLILDLNLEGDEGFDLLRDSTAAPFHTVVVSAHVERALEAFEYGVRDFVPKPFTRERFERALRRVLSPAPRNEPPPRFVGVRRSGAIEFVALDDIVCIRAAGDRSELVLANGRTCMHDKPLDRLESILPAHFERIHRSFIVDARQIARLVVREGSRYSVELRDGSVLPVGRTKVQSLRQRLA